jgi:hypothetical protein
MVVLRCLGVFWVFWGVFWVFRCEKWGEWHENSIKMGRNGTKTAQIAVFLMVSK